MILRDMVQGTLSGSSFGNRMWLPMTAGIPASMAARKGFSSRAELVRRETGHDAFITIDQEGGKVTRLPGDGCNVPGAMATASARIFRGTCPRTYCLSFFRLSYYILPLCRKGQAIP